MLYALTGSPDNSRYLVSRPQIVNDLRTLRELATALLRYDCVTFLTLLDTLRLSEGRNSVWLFHSAAHTIFQEASSPNKPLHIQCL